MMTSSNRNIFRVTGEFPAQRPVTRSFDVFFDLRLSKRLSKQCKIVSYLGDAGDLRRHRTHYDVILLINGWELLGLPVFAVVESSNIKMCYSGVCCATDFKHTLKIAFIESFYYPLDFFLPGGWNMQAIV